MAAVGTINLDYRSLYLHFENETYLCGSKKITVIRNDFLKNCEVSRRIAPGDIKENIFHRLLVGAVKLFVAQM